MAAEHETVTLPAGCSLQGSEATERVTAWREVLAAALIDRTATPRGVRLRLTRRPEVERCLTELVERERDCCASVAFDVAADGDHLVLEIAGTPAAAASVRAVFLAGPPGPSR